ncbi:hypothetical protein [Sphingomonas sp. PWP1-2]|uniref:hypothetical protein n=1 Tax=Sphingomonas sp. PWP1-2 TaxID=2804558 RepID=UPI003CE99D33
MILALLLSGLLLDQSSVPVAAQPINCDRGGAIHTFGGTKWIVFGCSDDQSTVVVSEAASPAAPFVFVIAPVDGHYTIHGEGNGSKSASDAAGDALKILGDDGLRALALSVQRTQK